MRSFFFFFGSDGGSQHVKDPVAGVEEHEAHGEYDTRVLVDEVHVLDLGHRSLQNRGTSLYRVQDLLEFRCYIT